MSSKSPVKLTPIHSVSRISTSLSELVYRPSEALRVLVKCDHHTTNAFELEYSFQASLLRGFVVLDEADLITIWESTDYVPKGSSILYEITKGSIFESFSHRSGILEISMPFGSLNKLHEYLVMSDNECVLVLSSQLPIVPQVTPSEPSQK
jgi:hypothetical protein